MYSPQTPVVAHRHERVWREIWRYGRRGDDRIGVISIAFAQDTRSQSWAADGVLLELPDRVIRGRDELVRMMDEFVQQWEGGTVRISELNTNVVFGHFLYAWAIFRSDNSICDRSIHAGEQGDDGRIRKIVSFHGEPPVVT